VGGAVTGLAEWKEGNGEEPAPIHEAQLLTYLKLSQRKVDLRINFNVLHLKDRIKRMVNNL